MYTKEAHEFPYPWQLHSKTLHLVRHGQATHNVEGAKNPEALLSPHLFDAPLSPLGFQQVAKLRKDVLAASGILDKIELVVTSPLSRAMQTATQVFTSTDYMQGKTTLPTLNSNYPQVMAVELCRDRLGLRPCDMRRKVSQCQFLFPTIDFSMMDSEDDNLWKPDKREAEEEIDKRVKKFLKWLWTRPEKEIAIVSHGLVLQKIVKTIVGPGSISDNNNPSVRAALCKRFDHCELRSIIVVTMDHDHQSWSPSLCFDIHQEVEFKQSYN